MSGHLCLKWNNHSSAFLTSISKIHLKERYCDATIACQGKYFAVHRIILSTCSDYFEEMFERMQCQHPYIVFKDIEPKEMELLLNYMYQGEVNVVQEMLPSLIKAAEALRIKGLAVSDEIPSPKESCGRKRSNTSKDNSEPKRRADENRKRRHSSDLNIQSNTNSNNTSFSSSESAVKLGKEYMEGPVIKQEPLQSLEYTESINSNYDSQILANNLPVSSIPQESASTNNNTSFLDFQESSNYIKQEQQTPLQPYTDQSSNWSDLGSGSEAQSHIHLQMSSHYDISKTNLEAEGSEPSAKEWDSSLGIARFNLFLTSANEKDVHLNCHTCPLCDYKSHRIDHVKTHIKFKHSDERPFQCHICSKKFVMKNGLDRHMLIHTGERPFQCLQCTKTFRQKNHLQAHEVSVHASS